MHAHEAPVATHGAVHHATIWPTGGWRHSAAGGTLCIRSDGREEYESAGKETKSCHQKMLRI